MDQRERLTACLAELRALTQTENPPFGKLSAIWDAVNPVVHFSPELARLAVDALCDIVAAIPHHEFSLGRRVATDLLTECTLRVVDGGRNLLDPSRLPTPAREVAGRGLALLTDLEQRYGGNCSSLYFAAAREIWRENFDLGYALFDRLRRAWSWINPPLFHQQGTYSVRPLGELLRLSAIPAPELPPARTMLRRDAPYVVIVCLDAGYFRRFGPELLRSLLPYDHVLPHFHVATAEPDAVTGAAPDCNFSFEPEPQVAQKNAWYASMRFIRMREFIRIYRRPLLFIDADMRFGKDPAGLFRHHQGMHVGLNFNHNFPSHVPWRRINGQQVYVDGGAESLRFATYLRNLFAQLFNPARATNWWIDQAILGHAVQIARINADPIRFVDNEWGTWSGLEPQR